MLKVCAAQVVHAVGWPSASGAAAVLYIGWKAYGAPLQVRFTGSKRMWRKPLATLATIDPLPPVVWSATAADSPAAVSGQLGLAIAFGGLPGPCNAPNWACRLSIVSAAHQCVRSQEPNPDRPGG